MRIARLIEPKHISVTNEVENDVISKDTVLIRVKAAAICGTDLHIYKGERTDVSLPRVMGHELSGIVEKIGDDVKHLTVGDHVVVDPVVSCGSCPACRKGHANVCAQVKCLGVQIDGGFQDLIQIPGERVYKISQDMSWEEASLVEPFSCAAQMVERGRVSVGDQVVIIGAGPIGLCVLEICKHLGAKVLISDIVESRLQIARQLGADVVVNSKNEDIVECVEEFTGYEGADVILDAVGVAKLLELSIQLAAPTARIIVIGFDGNPAQVPPVLVTKKELEIIGSRMNNKKFPQVISCLENGVLDPNSLITAKFQLEDIDQAFQEILQNPNENIKTVILF